MSKGGCLTLIFGQRLHNKAIGMVNHSIKLCLGNGAIEGDGVPMLVV